MMKSNLLNLGLRVMAKKKTSKEDRLKKLKAKQTKVEESINQDEFDFGGFPIDVSLKKNLGCGG